MNVIMIDPSFIRSINLGRCFALIGSGPSAELGYPSWKCLAEKIHDYILSTVLTADMPSYDQFLVEKNYPALFRQAEEDLGNREALFSVVETFIHPSGYTPSPSIYEYLAKWPFACYLTTNFDDEIQKALESQGQHFQVRYNTISDLSVLRNGISHLIVKIHSDLRHINDAVLTSVDYDRILTATEGHHIREKLKQIFGMFDVFIIGHSMSDPDLRLILQMAKYSVS